MLDEPGEGAAGEVLLTPWDDAGHAAIEATGSDFRTALEALLRGVLSLAAPEPAPPANPDETRAAPVRGEGDTLAALAADLVDDLLAEIDDAGTGSRAITLDGVVRRDDGGFVAWGYLETAARPAPRVAPLRMLREPDIIEEAAAQIRVRVRLARPRSR